MFTYLIKVWPQIKQLTNPGFAFSPAAAVAGLSFYLIF